jgi:hypothetical protein
VRPAEGEEARDDALDPRHVARKREDHAPVELVPRDVAPRGVRLHACATRRTALNVTWSCRRPRSRRRSARLRSRR